MRRSARQAIGVGAIALTVSASACAPEPAPDPSVSSPSPQTTAPSQSGNAEAEFRDGEYSARGWYGSLPSHHDVTLTIRNDVVSAVEITTPAEDSTSLGYQERFADALPDAVIGRSIDELAVDRLAGSSGCSEGFMDALAQIKQQAAAG
jgi:uncharacterized protein with FMN-binding domain